MSVLVEDGNWGAWGGLERIDIDIDDPQDIATTHQFDGSWCEYVVTTEVHPVNEDLLEYHIHYNREDHLHLIDEFGEDAFTWGTHILLLEAGEDFGESIWNGQAGPGWRRESIIGGHRRITTTTLQRSQAKFREMLLAGMAAVR